ncbi:2-succinyl-5-enolpyruvyl-6-hydroxy-3-cyclohexene-1-carboxylic-acid synthase [Ereboglobus luteus]|uniref:2-succinyl-5-enolpyruvyl-6-hydroxy-3-cyclohexene-1-carboxylate synthase n=1 Tax=Ereboglobus luteus TaxID=1796921 RepID=A0A2U8E469_9BACT|nr:2-succinyl-5-enolpyruvyl-6-hydroxy-3-cyclohexene-1-carboxylic-acid synthase [Ereboglobus luteus]AWI09600.1 2-succinyl-5-enolpyruvyl-6-hydroxy-3-cyclohexene-1-carboxylic-acid synthase [Ereboglobus luteus]
MPGFNELDFRNTNSLWCGVLAETLHRCGVQQAVVSPGSRSTPLVFALARHSRIETHPVLDERSAAFFALGIAKSSMRPVALVCTSGTAAANFFPAIIEAQESGAPLVVITADRPPEMRECSSGQTIDQQKLYGSHVNWYHELAVPEPAIERLRYLRQTIAFAVARSTQPERGPVHLNAPFRDPLPPVEDKNGIVDRERIEAEFFHDNWRHFDAGAQCSDNTVFAPIRDLSREKRGLIIAGPGGVQNASEIAASTGWPVLADALSHERHLETSPSVIRVSAYDAILRNEAAAASLAPSFVLCAGGWPTSKILRAWIENTQPAVLMVAPTFHNRDALHCRTTWVRGNHIAPFRDPPKSASDDYRDAWARAEKSARATLDTALDTVADTDLFEPRATSLLAKHLPKQTNIFIANSMPVRDAEYFWPANDRCHFIHHNRGANGIDGTLSTALGVAHGTGNPAVLLTGDLSLLHDTNGFLLANASRTRGSLTIVLVNNNGGGIFEHLPVAQFDPPFEEYFATPQNIDFAKLCATYGVEHTRIESWTQFTKLISTLPERGVRVLEIPTDRKRDTARRKALLAQAAAAV